MGTGFAFMLATRPENQTKSMIMNPRLCGDTDQLIEVKNVYGLKILEKAAWCATGHARDGHTVIGLGAEFGAPINYGTAGPE